MATFHLSVKSGKKGTALDHARYIARQGRYAKRTDLMATGHGNMPSWTNGDPQEFWKAADKYERVNGAAHREYVFSLPNELSLEQNLEAMHEFAAVLTENKPFQWSMHGPISALEGERNVHVHVMTSDRMDDGISRTPQGTFSRYNPKHPQIGGRKKSSGGRAPSVLSSELQDLRRKCAECQNNALAKHGHDARVDHRSLKEQQIDRTPERHLGPARIRGMSPDEKADYVRAR